VKEFLSQRGVQFQEHDVAKDEDARNEMMQKTGKMAVPTVVINGKAVVGFDRDELEKLIH